MAIQEMQQLFQHKLTWLAAHKMEVENSRKPIKGLSIEVQDMNFIYEYPHINHKDWTYIPVLLDQ